MSEYKPIRPRLRWIRDKPDPKSNPNPNINPNPNPNPNPNLPRQTYEEITPSFGWTQDSLHHYLLVNLLGFKKDDVKFEIDNSGAIAIKGEMVKGEGKHERFEMAIAVPDNAIIEDISMRFEGDSLRLVIPKRKKDNMNQEKLSKDEASSSNSKEGKKKRMEEDERPKVESNGKKTNEVDKEEEKNSSHSEEEGDKMREGLSQGDNTSEKSAIRVVIETKGILIASILSFTLGFLLSQKFHALPPK